MCENDKLEYIIRSRIRDYENDVNCIIATKYDTTEHEERIRQDKVIIQELEKILTGKNLGVLSYI